MTTTKEQLQLEYNMSDDGNKWCTAMKWLFALCDILTNNDIPIPDSFGFKQAPSGSDKEDYYYRNLKMFYNSKDDLQVLLEFAIEINDLCDELKAKGEDY